MPAPLLSLTAARIDVAGAPAIDGLSFATTERRVIVLGASRALFEAAAGTLPPVHGEVLVSGEPATAALAAAHVAGAPLDAAAPPAWTVREYVEWSARLSGQPKGEARAAATRALEDLRVVSLATSLLGRVPLHARRAIGVAAAVATGAPAIMLEDPLVGLPDDVARNLAKLVTQALADRAWVVFAGRMPLASPLALAADEAVVLAGSEVAAQGQPAEIAAADRTFALRVLGAVDAFTSYATSRGAAVVRAHGMEVTLELGPLSTTELMAIAGEAGAVIVELLPLTRALQ